MKCNFRRCRTSLEREITNFIKQHEVLKKYSIKLEHDKNQLPSFEKLSKKPQDNNEVFSQVEKIAIQKAEIDNKIACIEEAFNKIPQEYRKYLYDYFVKSTSLESCPYAHKNTLYKYRKIIILSVARSRGYDENYINFLEEELKKSKK